jgi:transcriptional regulator with XRE-family HTH domain
MIAGKGATMRGEYTLAEKQRMAKKALSLRYDQGWTWDQIAKELGVSRSTLSEWRTSSEWKRLEYQKRAAIREEARADSSQMVKEAIEVLFELMRTSDNERIRLAAAQKLIDINRLEDDDGPEETDSAEYSEFLRLKQERELGAVRPGGLVPEDIVEETEQYRARVASGNKKRAGD